MSPLDEVVCSSGPGLIIPHGCHPPWLLLIQHKPYYSMQMKKVPWDNQNIFFFNIYRSKCPVVALVLGVTWGLTFQSVWINLPESVWGGGLTKFLPVSGRWWGWWCWWWQRWRVEEQVQGFLLLVCPHLLKRLITEVHKCILPGNAVIHWRYKYNIAVLIYRETFPKAQEICLPK